MTLGTQTQPYGKLLDYEQFIDHQLARTRARIKLTDIMTAGLTLLVGFVAVLFLEVVLDHIVGLPLTLRQITLAAGLSVACAFTALRLVMPLMRRINSIYAAKTIENADSSFKNSLINYLELRRHRAQLSKTVMATIEARAVNDLAHVEIDGVVNQQRMMKMFYALSAVIVVFCLYAALTPKSILDSARRAFLADIVRPTNTQLLNIKPGNNPELSKVVAGDNVNFAVNVDGTRPRKVVMHYSVDGGKFFALKEFLPGRHMYDPWQVLMNNVQQSMDYYLTAGDAESLRYHLEVLPAPTVTSIALDLKFPDYTKVEPRLNVEGGHVEAIEDTMVTVHATTNMPASTATLNIVNKESVPMEIAAEDPTVLTGKFKVDKSGTYTIKFRTTGGQLNPNPVVYEIFAIPDRPPTAQFILPDQPTVKVPANVKVDLAMKGTDDHGVKDATLHVTLGNENLVSKNMLEGQPPQPEFRAVESLDLVQLRVKPGAVLNYWLTVKDNKEPSSNKTETTRQVIEVIEPVSPTNKRQFEENQTKEREQLDPSTPTSQDEEPKADQPPQAAEGKSDERAHDGGGAGQDQNPARTGQKSADGQAPPDQGQGNRDETNRDQQNGDSKDNSGRPLSPEQLREWAQKINNQLKNKGPDPNQANKGGAPNSDPNQPRPSSNNSPVSDAARSRDANPPSSPEKNRGNRPAQENPNGPAGSNPQTPPGNNNPTDSSSPATPGIRDQNQPPAAPDQNQGAKPNATPSGGGRSADGKAGDTKAAGGTEPKPKSKEDGQSADGKAGDNKAAGGTEPKPKSKEDGQSADGKAGDNKAAGGTEPKPKSKEDGQSADGKAGDNKAAGGTEPKSKSKEDGQSADGKAGDNKAAGGTEPKSKSKEDGQSADGKAGDNKAAGGTEPKPKSKEDGQSADGKAGDNQAAGGTEPKPKSKEDGQSADGKAGDNQAAGGTEPKSKSEEGSGSRPGDSTESSQNAGAEQKPGSNTASQRSQDAMKPNDSRQSPSVPGSKEAGERESQPGTGKSNEEPKDKPGDSGKARDSNANLKKKARDNRAAPSEMSAPKAADSSNEPKEPQAKSDQDQRADQKGMEKANQPGRDEASKAKAKDKTAAERLQDAQDPSQPQTPRARPANGEQEPKNPEDSAAYQDPKRDPTPREPRNTMPADKRKLEPHKPKEPPPPPDQPADSDQQEPKRPQDPLADRDRKTVPPQQDPRNTLPADERNKEVPDPRAPQTPKDQREPNKTPNQPGETREQKPDDRQQTPKAPQTGDMQERQSDNPPSNANTPQSPSEPQKEKGPSQRKTRSRDPLKSDRTGQDELQRPPAPDRLPSESTTPKDEETPQPQEQTSQDTPLERQNPGRPRDRTLPPPAQKKFNPLNQAQSPDRVRNTRQTTRSDEKMPKDAQQSSPQSQPSSQTGQPGQPDSTQEGQTRQEQLGKSGASGDKIKGPGAESGKEIAGSEKSGGQGKPSGAGNEPTAESGGQPGEKSGAGSGGKEESSSSSSTQKSSSGGKKSSQTSNSSQGGGPPSGESGKSHSGSEEQGGSHPGQGGQGGEKPSGDRPGEGGRNNTGGGGTARSGGTAGEPAKDGTQPTPRAKEPENAPNGDNVAPQGASQTDLNLRTLQDVLKDPEASKNLEKDTGLNREQLEQFATEYKKSQMKSGRAGPGREIEVKPGEQTESKPAANLPGLDAKTTFSTKNVRDRGTMAQDDVRNNLEGVRYQVPSEWRGKYEGYRNKLGKVAAPKRKPQPQPQPSSKPGP